LGVDPLHLPLEGEGKTLRKERPILEEDW